MNRTAKHRLAVAIARTKQTAYTLELENRDRFMYTGLQVCRGSADRGPQVSRSAVRTDGDEDSD